MTPGKGRNSQKSDGIGEERYQIAISYAHSDARKTDLSYIDQTYKALIELGLKVFYSKSKKAQEKLFGKKLDKAFHDVFSKTEYILVFISWQYMQAEEERKILDIEKRIALSPLSLETGSILPVVFDEAVVPENLREYQYLLVENYKNPSELAKVIKECYKEIGEDTHDKSFFSQGIFYYLQGYIEEAIKKFGEAIRVQPNDAKAYYNRGYAKNKLERYKEAIKDFDEAIRLQPGNAYAYAYNNRGIANAKLEHYKEAFKDYDEAIRLRPDNASAYYNRGNIKNKLENYKEAIEDFDEAIRLLPNDAKAYCNRGLANAKLGHYKEAIEDFDEAIRLLPNDAKAYLARGLTNAKLEHYKKAIKDLGRSDQVTTKECHCLLYPLLCQKSARALR